MGLREAIGTSAFTLTAELTPCADAARLVEQARRLAGWVDAVQVTDNPGGRVHMSALVAAGLLRQAGIDPVLHMNCRDRNRVALYSDLIGAAGLGISSLLIMRGNEMPPRRRTSTVNGVFDLGATQLIAAARAMRDDEGAATLGAARPADFFLGAIARVFAPKATWEPRTLLTKVDAGARFVQTQLCFDMKVLRRYMARLVAAQLPRRAHVLVGLAPLPSADTARWLRDHVKGPLVPDAVIQRIEQARDPEAAGVEICAELLQEAAEIPGISGANLLTPANLEVIPAAIRAAGLRPDLAVSAG
jgi:methylenetetrahydrofolate reductase (NADPH)